jgi:hypothetical protein
LCQRVAIGAKLPKRFLKTLGQGREALATLNGFDLLPDAVGHPEMIEMVGEGLTGQRHAEIAGIGKVRQGLVPGRMILAEDQVAIRSLGGSPMGNPALKRTQETIGETVRMKAPKFLKQGRGLNTRNFTEQRHQILLPDLFEGIAARSVLAR